MNDRSAPGVAVPEAWAPAYMDLRQSRPDTSVRPPDANGVPADAVDHVDPDAGSEQDDFRQRYCTTSAIGRGGMGMVWLAQQRALNRHVALKVAYERLGDRQRAHFQVEASCTAFLEHPNIVPVYDAGPDFIVMKRIEGDTLERLLVQERLRIPDIIDILIKVCDAMSFAHSRGIIHRDIKPDNIMIGRFGEVVLMDWGLALQIDLPPDGTPRAPLKGTRSTLCAGTPGYMAPEMAHADADLIGYPTDVFLLGATLYRCLGGAIPFDGTDALQALSRSAENDWRPLLQLNEHIPPRLIAVQERCMADAPHDRPSVSDVQGVLRDWLMSANAETEAERCFSRGTELLLIARNAGRRSDEAYSAYSEALHYLDRAVTLCPDRIEHERARGDVVREFAWAAASAGEPGLARLLKRSGRLPSPSGASPSEALSDRMAKSRQMATALVDARRNLDALGQRVAALEDQLEQKNREITGWQVSASLLAVSLLLLALAWLT